MPGTDRMADDIALLREAASAASLVAMPYFRGDRALEVRMKDGTSPVSAGDMAVNDVLRTMLADARPDYGWLSEESPDALSNGRREAARTFVVDPIDGTRAFISGNPTWCISIGIVEDGVPIVGVLACPAMGETFHAARGLGAYRDDTQLPALASATPSGHIAGHRDLVQRLSVGQGVAARHHPHVPSLAYRIAMVADGRLGGTFIRAGAHDWDIAAAMVILSEAGGCMTGLAWDTVTLNGHGVRKPSLVAAHPALLTPMVAVANT